MSRIDPWFLNQLKDISDFEKTLQTMPLDAEHLFAAKRMGFSDAQIALAKGVKEQKIRERRWALKVRPSFKLVDTCAGEFPSATPYFYSTYEETGDLIPAKGGKKVVILGSGPNRIGQGIEFDYCCVQASKLRDARLAVRDGQLQPRDRLDRLRLLRPALFRAADARGRPRDHRGREADGRHRAVRRPDAAEPRGPA